MQQDSFKFWKKLSHQEITKRINSALAENQDFLHSDLLGVPASHLDPKVFPNDAPFLSNAPFLNTLLKNPNHIGCHTLGSSESFFSGTQKIERELINICATDILKAEPKSCDGYVAAGGTEANIQAVWTYRNYFKNEHSASNSEICIVTSSDAHYSMAKAADLLNIDVFHVPVDEHHRNVLPESIRATITEAKSNGKKYFIVVCNMMTTMFGSVDSISDYVDVLQEFEVDFKMHVDGAYGGFLYPFTNPNSALNFANPHVSSITLDAHKLVQAPYGTGVLIMRKGLIENVYTKSAEYVKGLDVTLSGSRSGANAIAVWMILTTYGPDGWMQKNQNLLKRTSWFCQQLDSLNFSYYRNQFSNIVTIRAAHISSETAQKFGLVPDIHGNNPNCYKVVVMEHVTAKKLE
ncbi:MAG: pyridoxal phosphate-dependent decarboxylase family protein, partial [Flavobacteriales bacterium]